MENSIRKFHRLASLLVLLLCVSWAHGSHVMGFYTEMECQNACTTRMHFRAYRDCAGITGITNTFVFTGTTPGCVAPAALGPSSPIVTVEVTPLCAAVPTQCSTPGAAFNGVEEYYSYRDYDVCGLTGCTYDIDWSTCCRNGVINSGAANNSSGLRNSIVLQATCNNTPVFTNYPLFFGCVGSNYTVHQGAYDLDGDSLSYGLTACYDIPPTLITYNAGFSPTQPLGPSWNITIDPNTGILNIVAAPGNAVVGVLCIQVSEYRNGVLIGTSTRDMQIQMGNFCGGNVAPSIGGIANLSAGANLSSPYVVDVCPGTAFCFDIAATDPDTATGQHVKLYWDGNIAGASFTEAGFPAVVDTVQDSTPVARFCWTAPSVPGSYQFLVTAVDNACPLIVPQDRLITIRVSAGGAASLITSSLTYQACAGTGDTLSAPAGYTGYAWSTGGTTSSIVVNAPGTYGLTVTTASGCTFTDAYTVTSIGPDVSGIVLDHLGAPLAGQKVYLIDHDPALASLSAVDSTTTDAAGYYEFCTVAIDTAYIKAAPDSVTYPSDMPTYANASLFWMTANGVPAGSFPATVNFATLFGSNPGGPGFIGGLLSQGANKVAAPGDPMPGMTMWLYSSTLSQPIDYTVTDANGYFSFGNLPYGTYYVIADKPRVSVSNLPVITVDAQNVAMDSLDFRLHSTYLELVTNSVGVTPVKPGFSVSVIPHPVGDVAMMLMNLTAETIFDFSVYDLVGRQLFMSAPIGLAAGQHRLPFTPKQWGISAGTYFVRIQAGAESHTIKVVVQ